VIVALLLIGVGMSTVFLIPFVLLGLAVLFAAPIIGLIKGDERGGGKASSDPSGVPSTREASYDPVQEP
jgi:hypothetical protein